MSRFPVTMKRTISGAFICAGLAVAAGSAYAVVTPFQADVSTAIDRGLAWMTANGGFTGGAGDATGLTMEALLEKRDPLVPLGPAQGYLNATAADKTSLRSAATYILNGTSSNGTGFYAYRDGARMFALTEYALSGGPDKAALATSVPAQVAAITIKAAMDNLVDKTLAMQRTAAGSPGAPYFQPGYAAAAEQGYWCYNDSTCKDSSTTQFAVAGLAAAKSLYSSAISGDAGPYADPVRVGKINTALTLAKTAYELNAGATGSDDTGGTCGTGGTGVLTATERGHGYHPPVESYKPSLQQTASGVYIQVFGGSTVNSPMVQAYLQWLKNRYRYADLDSKGNGFQGLTWSYYLWSSFKGNELIRLSAIVPLAGNVGPDDMGTLPAASAPACANRQVNKTTASLARVPSFGAGAVGYYSAETANQYFDYAHQLLAMQCTGGSAGSFTCTGYPGAWDTFSHNAYALLVLLRATGGACVDSDGDGICDAVDNCPGVFNPDQNPAACATTCDLDGNGIIDRVDIAAVVALRNKPASANPKADADGNGVINALDARACTLRCTYANCSPTP